MSGNLVGRLRKSRRRFLKAGAIAAGGIVLIPLLEACSGGNNAGPNLPTNTGGGNQPSDPPDANAYHTKTYKHPPMTMGTMLGGGKQIRKDTDEERWVFTMINLDQTPLQPRIVVLDFKVHGVIVNPLDIGQVVLLEKKNDGGVLVDLTKGEVIRDIKPAKGHEFYGHGDYSPDGKIRYTTEYGEEDFVGRISIRDSRTFEVLDFFPSHGDYPHDCVFFEGGTKVAITNGGGHINEGARPNVTIVEVPSGKLLETLEFEDEKLNSGHLAFSENGDLVVVSSMREGLDRKTGLGGISFRPKGGKWKTMTKPEEVTGKMLGETLSIAIHEGRGIAAATNPFGDLVTFWDYRTMEFKGQLRMDDQPRGVAVTLDQKYFLVTFGTLPSPSVVLVDAGTLKVVDGSVFPAAISGSHVYIHDFPV